MPITANNSAMPANTLSIAAVTRWGDREDDSILSSVCTLPGASAGSSDVITRCTSEVTASGLPAVRTTSVIVSHGPCAAATYTTGASSARPTFGLCRTSATTPTTVVRYIESARKEIRLPTASWPGQYLRANASLTIATDGCAVSS